MPHWRDRASVSVSRSTNAPRAAGSFQVPTSFSSFPSLPLPPTPTPFRLPCMQARQSRSEPGCVKSTRNRPRGRGYKYRGPVSPAAHHSTTAAAREHTRKHTSCPAALPSYPSCRRLRVTPADRQIETYMQASLASYAAAAAATMPALELLPEMAHAHQPAIISPSHHHHGWDGANNVPAAAPAPAPAKRLDGKVVIVTGGARGIGEAVVRVCVKHGARVVIADIDAAAGDALAAALGSNLVSCVRCDVSVEDDVKRAVDWTVARHGRVDVLVNNAGVLGRQTPAARSVLSFDAGEFDRVLRVNVLGPALCLKHAAKAMVPRRQGSIVSVASVAGVLGGLGPHAYTASKHALVGLTKNAACELGAHGIRVNCVSPFGVATPMLINAWRQGHAAHDDHDADIEVAVPSDEEVEKMEEVVRGFATLKGPTLRPRDVAEAVLFLASDEARYISGHNLVVDGGVTASRNLIGL